MKNHLDEMVVGEHVCFLHPETGETLAEKTIEDYLHMEVEEYNKLVAQAKFDSVM